MKSEDFYDAVWERLCALKHYKLISRGKRFRISKRGEEFLKTPEKEYYLAKITIQEKLERIRYPEILIASLREFLNLKNSEIKAIKTFLERRGDPEYIESPEIEKDREILQKFLERIHKKLRKTTTKEKIAEVFDRNMRKNVVGTKALIDFDLNVLRRFITEIEKKIQSLDEFKEVDLEELIRRNFENIFPSMEIIDNGKHYRTKAGSYIDILAKEKGSEKYIVIEIKRGRSSIDALTQLLDYINQIMTEFKTKNVKGILICKTVDKRLESALKAIRRKLKNPDDISILIFDFKLGMQKI